MKENSFLSFMKTKAKFITYVTVPLAILLFIIAIVSGKNSAALLTFTDTTEYNLRTIATIVLIVAAASTVLSLVSLIVAILKKKIVNSLSILVFEALLIISIVLSAISGGVSGIFLMVISAIINLVGLITAYIAYFAIEKENVDNTKQKMNSKIAKIASLIVNLLTVILTVALFFLPYYNDGINNVSLNGALKGTDMTLKIIYLTFIILYISNVAVFISTFKYYFKDDERYFKSSKLSMYYSCGVSLLFYLSGIVMILFNDASTSTAPFVLFLANSALLIVESIFAAKYLSLPEKEEKAKTNKSVYKIIIILFVFIFSALIFIALGSNLISITFKESTYSVQKSISIKGYDVIFNYKKYGEGYRFIALVLYFVLISNVISTTASAVLFFSKSKSFKTLSIVSIAMNFLFIFALELFGRYYKIIQAMNEDQITETLKIYGYTYNSSITYTIDSDMTILFIVGASLLLLLLVIKPFSRYVENNEVDVNIKSTSLEGIGATEQITKKDSENQNDALSTNNSDIDFDPCPQFSEIDDEYENIKNTYEEKLTHNIGDVTLPQFTKFIVDYAKESRLHLSYTPEVIAEFIAGLGSTRLSILQGMSGTGKTSLPKIFSEAILGNCNIIEVESSWKDKNELIGYYNEFSKKFTPKKFTQALYRAKLDENVVTFIVLDEMNLSRIEYYFSDFLSLMENEEDKREIKLLNIKIYKNENGKFENYLALSNGHTLKIPKNVWFIGTANKDESTFEISDKVYDRANTMNFNKRAKKVTEYSNPLEQKFITYTDFKALLDKAIETSNFDIEQSDIIKNVEEILAPYNISFGNRIYNQIEKYVKIYCSCFYDPESKKNEAIEKILLNKVVAKLEYKSIENKEELINQFEALNLHMCSEFIKKLNEDI